MHNTKEKDKEERQERRGKKRKGIKAQKVKFPTPSWAIDAFIGDEEQNGKQKKETEQVPNPTTLDHSVTSYDI